MSRFAAIIKHKNLTVEMPEIEAMKGGVSTEGRRPDAVYIKDNVALLANPTVSGGEKTAPCDGVVHVCGNRVIVFDGALTNASTLKAALIDVNPHFYAATDAETVMFACEQWGMEKALQRLDGAFAFTLYDTTTDTVYIARDRLGIKPLYYYMDTAGLYAASTLRALTQTSFPKTISKEGLNLFISLTYIPAPFTIYENVHKLPAGSYLLIRNDETVLKTYYRMEDHTRPSTLTFDRAKEQLKQLLTDSVRTLMDDNAPAGVLLSGGIDSSVVAGIMSQQTSKPVPSFSIGFKEKEHDESDRALLASEAFGTNHTIHYLDYDDVADVLDEIIDYFDEPFGDSSAIPTYYVAKMASEKVKTVFTGDCADELFGGYNKYLRAHYTAMYRRLPKPLRCLIEKTIRLIPRAWERHPRIRQMKQLITHASRSQFEAYFQSMCLGYPDNERCHLIKPVFYADIKPAVEKEYRRYSFSTNYELRITNYDRRDPVNNAMFVDCIVSLEGDMNPKMERMCMMNALTARSPFSSAEVVEFALSLPAAYKVKGRKKKYIVREAFKDLLPPKVLSFSKHGFTAPVAQWLRKELRHDLLQLLDNEMLEKQGVFNVETVTGLVEQHLKGDCDHSRTLWNLLVFQKWYVKNLLK